MIVNVLIRLPVELRDDLRVWAEQENRSVNNLIVWLLRRALNELRS